MPVRIRLQRRGRTHFPFYAIVVADSRAPRDGKFIEKLGYYNPHTNPATIEINFDRALYWLQVGAQPSETARAILSREGVLMMNHLLKGVRKGAFDEEEAKRRFNEWKQQKLAKLRSEKENVEKQTKEKLQKQLEEEKKIAEKRAEELSKKLAEENAAEAEASSEEATENQEGQQETAE